MWEVIAAVAAALFSYFCCSVNYAILIGRWFAKDDIRDHGSGNAGMTNVLRTYGSLPAALTFIGDFLKGAVSVWFGAFLLNLAFDPFPFWGYYLILIPGLLGHCFPVYYGFRGGKGVMVCAGMICVMDWQVLLVILGIFLIAILCSRYISLGSICAAVGFPVATLVLGWFRGNTETLFWDTLLALIVGGIVFFLHRGNLLRLIQKTERKISIGRRK